MTIFVTPPGGQGEPQPTLVGDIEVDLFEVARGLYAFAANRSSEKAAIRVETLCARAHPTVWKGLTIGNRKSLGRVFVQLIDKMYGRGVTVD